MNKKEIKKALCDAVDSAAKNIELFANDMANHPELGFNEKYTSAKLADELESLGLTVSRNIALTGIRSDINGKTLGPKIAVMGELDGITCQSHPQADPSTGASHSCGHNLQTAIVLAVATALTKTGIMKDLSGTVSLMGVPAEEFIEIEHRKEMKDSGQIVYLCGKPEFIRLGILDDIAMSMMIHAGEDVQGKGFALPTTGIGFRVFMLQYIGVQAHAAAAPDKGINALNAAIIGINAVNALRETFRDEDHVRVHYIITKGGSSANSVPSDVRLEGYVRAGKADCIDMVFEKVINAFRAGALAIGAKCFVTSLPGDMPLNASEDLNEVFCSNASELVGSENVICGTHFAASTDMGDVTHLMPAIHPFGGGVAGSLHAADFRVTDFDAAVLTPAKAILMTLVDLLADDAVSAKKIVRNFKPVYTKEEYLAAMDKRFFSEI